MRNATMVRGYAWHAHTDSEDFDIMAGDNPFATGEPPGDPILPRTPPSDVERFWPVSDDQPGLANRNVGGGFLVVTAEQQPPQILGSWTIEPAQVNESFLIRGENAQPIVQLVRVIDSAETPWGTLQNCEFQVDEERA